MHSGRRGILFLTGVVASALLPFSVFAATSSGGGASIALRIVQIFWIIIALASLGVLIYAIIRMRRFRDDLLQFEQAKRIVLFSAIALGVALLLCGIVTFFIARSSSPSGITAPTNNEPAIQAGLGNQLGPASKIAQHYPSRDQRGVPRNVSILITFKDDVNAASVFDTSGVLKTDVISIQRLRDDDVAQGDLLPAHVSLLGDKRTLKIIPDQLLGLEGESSTKYKVTISPKLQNTQNASIFGGTGSYDWNFYVGTQIDTAPPQVVSVFPGTSKDSVARNALIQMTFSKAIDPSTVVDGSFEILDAATSKPISGHLGIYNNYRSVVFTPSEMCGTNSCNQKTYCLPESTRVSVRIKAATIRTPRDSQTPNAAHLPYDGIVDAQGNSLDGGGADGAKKDGIAQGTKDDDYTWMFSTNSSMDTTAPTIVSMVPGRNGTRVDLQAPVQVRFSKVMDPSSLDQSTVVLDKGIQYWLDTDIDATKKQSVVSVNHDKFTENTIYSPQVQGQVRDGYQNCFAPCTGPIQ